MVTSENPMLIDEDDDHDASVQLKIHINLFK